MGQKAIPPEFATLWCPKKILSPKSHKKMEAESKKLSMSEEWKYLVLNSEFSASSPNPPPIKENKNQK